MVSEHICNMPIKVSMEVRIIQKNNTSSKKQVTSHHCPKLAGITLSCAEIYREHLCAHERKASWHKTWPYVYTKAKLHAKKIFMTVNLIITLSFS